MTLRARGFAGGLTSLAVVAASACAPAAAPPTRAADQTLGPGDVTVRLGIEHSAFSEPRVMVRSGSTVRFVVLNSDPIAHEFIVGPPEVHKRHANGTEVHQGDVAGEVSVAALRSAATTYRFDTPGVFPFACHLKGHFAYGMRGVVVVT